jgi:Acetyltransferases, including N-acetylases of ribosomal proteins
MKDFFLTSERLGFSVWEKGDLPDALKLWGSPEVTRYITADGRMSREQIRKRLEREIETYKKLNVQYWPVYIKETGKNAGCCGLRPYDYKNKIYEMGIHLKEQYWGCGLAQEACSAVMEYAFTVLGAGAIFAGHNPNNAASARLLKRLGFTYLRDELYLPTGLYHPSYLMTAEEYKNR